MTVVNHQGDALCFLEPGESLMFNSEEFHSDPLIEERDGEFWLCHDFCEEREPVPWMNEGF